MLRVSTLEPVSDVRQRGDAIEIDEDRDQAFSLLAVAQGPLQEARLAVLSRREQAHEVAADDVPQQLLRLAVAVDDLLGSEGVGIDERVDLGDQVSDRLPESCLLDY